MNTDPELEEFEELEEELDEYEDDEMIWDLLDDQYERDAATEDDTPIRHPLLKIILTLIVAALLVKLFFH